MKTLILAVLGLSVKSMKLANEEDGDMMMDGCSCVDMNGISPTFMDGVGMLDVFDGQCNALMLPMNYGTEECMAWDADNCADEGAEYCEAEWCYVNDDCMAEDKQKSGLGSPFYFSYMACGNEVELEASSEESKTQEQCMEEAAEAAAA